MKAIDLFAGLGGFSTGAAMAGASVVWAGNHWPAAVDLHQRNHPNAIHVCQDLQQADWSQVPDHDVMLASPACQGHSRAKGARNGPAQDLSRSTAWAVVSAAEVKRPRTVVVENVPEFLTWTLFPAWSEAMRALGYHLVSQVIDAADHGVPQNRRRLFVVANQRKALWPTLPRRAHVPASTIIVDDGARWSAVDRPGRAAATLARVEAGRRTHGQRFLMAFYGSTSGGRSLDRPIGTITTRDRYALVDGDKMRMLSAKEYAGAMGFPSTTILPDSHKAAVHMLGNAVCPPVARDIVAEIMRAA
jgi:DNA (cytosine-5)-methyltransferase 1